MIQSSAVGHRITRITGPNNCLSFEQIVLPCFCFSVSEVAFFYPTKCVLFYFCVSLYRSPLSPSSVSGSHALPQPVTSGTTTGLLTTPTKKTHQRSKSDATAAITTASSRLMQVGHLHWLWSSNILENFEDFSFVFHWCGMCDVNFS